MTTRTQVAMVTGGNRGIGRAVVERLAAKGWTVAFCGRDRAAIAATERELAELYPGPVFGQVADVRDLAAVEAWAAAVEERSGGIDCLVNNAGLGHFGPVDEIAPEAFREVVETNLLGAFHCVRAVVPAMKRHGGGWIFNIASLAAKNPFANGSAYNASKFGLLGFSEAAMLDLRPHGIRMAAILPGSVATDFANRPGEEWMLAPHDVAQVVVDLLGYPERALPSRVEIRPTHPPAQPRRR